MKKALTCILAFTVALAIIPLSTALFASAKPAEISSWNDLSKYDLYSSVEGETFVKDGDAIVATTTGALKGLYKGLQLSDFTATMETALDENGKSYAGIVFRASEAGAPKDELCGYVLQLRYNGAGSTKTRLDLVVYKWGKANGVYKFMGEVGRLTNSEDAFILKDIETLANTKLVVTLKVEGDTATASCALKNDPTKTTGDLVADLKKVTKASGVEYPDSYASGRIGIYAGTSGGATTDRFESLTVTYDDETASEIESTTSSSAETGTTTSTPAETGTTTTTVPEQDLNATTFSKPAAGVVPGPLGKADSYASFSMNDTHIAVADGKFSANTVGNKKILLKNSWYEDFTANLTVKVDENGNLKTGIPFRVVYADNGRDGLQGYLCVIQRIAGKNRMDIIIYKYGEINGKISYMGEVGRSVNEGKESIIADMPEGFAGQELILTLKVEGKKATASFCMKDQPIKVSKTLECWLNMKTSKETTLLAKYYEAGVIGLYMGEVNANTPINSLAYDFTVKAPGESTNTEDPGDSGNTEKPDNSGNTENPGTGREFPAAIVGTLMLSAAALLVARRRLLCHKG